MLHIVLYQPVIPQNTGSIARLCACTGAKLHLIHPLGFKTDSSSVKRAGLDYWPFVAIKEHPDWNSFLETEKPGSLAFFSKFAHRAYTTVSFSKDQFLVFGSETSGLPKSFFTTYKDQVYKVPMRTYLVRSLNLAQCAAVVLYEALRQNDFVEINSSLGTEHALPDSEELAYREVDFPDSDYNFLETGPSGS